MASGYLTFGACSPSALRPESPLHIATMGRALVSHEGEATTFTMPRNPVMVVALLAAIVISAGIAGFVLRGDGGEPTLLTWLFPAMVAAGLLPAVANAAVAQHVRIDREGIATVKWFGRRSIAWSDAREAIGYTNGQELFLRVRDGRGRILISTRFAGWDAAEMRAMARAIDVVLDRYHPHVERPGPLERFPSLFSKESGLVRRS